MSVDVNVLNAVATLPRLSMIDSSWPTGSVGAIARIVLAAATMTAVVGLVVFRFLSESRSPAGATAIAMGLAAGRTGAYCLLAPRLRWADGVGS